MTFAQKVDAWAGKHVKVHRRVTEDGQHHVWFYHGGFRVDRYDRDFEESNRLVWVWLVAAGWTRGQEVW